MSNQHHKYRTFGQAAEFDRATEWINCDHAPTIESLRGRVVLLSFWTYGNINCIHALADIAHLRQKHGAALTVIGIHSGKFTTEKNTDSIRRAAQQHGVDYPVANDTQARIWKAYGAQAWPTLCLIDPLGEVVKAYSGDGHRKDQDDDIGALIEYYRSEGGLVETPLDGTRELAAIDFSGLSFPGKILADEAGGRLFISDSGHHRIVICDLNGRVSGVVGSSLPSLAEGSFQDAAFCNPQGLALRENILYVADTDNHAIRAVDLSARTVTTFGGCGIRGDFRTMRGGPDTLLCSPWDLVIVDNMLYVAMAGSHQIWRAAIETANFRPYAGSGVEELGDAPGPSARLAQPSGISEGKDYLFIADAGSSAIRRANLLDSGRMETVIGKGLFEFGDQSGPAIQTRLQHPMGVHWHDGRLFIADTYNHRIKVLDPRYGMVENVIGTGRPGGGEGTDAGLNEPNDIAMTKDRLYIADTNNHRVVVLDMKSESMQVLPIHV